MMISPEERLQWKTDSENVDKFVDVMVRGIKEVQGQEAVVYMAVDMIFRSYLQWVHSAQLMRANPELARDSVVNVMNIIVMELANRIRGVDDRGVRVDLTQWVSELMQYLAKTLLEDCIKAEHPKRIIIPD